jgi:hypothetical protein
MLGHVGGGAAIFAPDREALQQAQRQEQHRREPADARIGRQQADQECRRAHHHDGHKEGVFAADKIADSTEEQRAERAYQETRRIGSESRQKCRRVVTGREEQRSEERRQDRVEVEVIPLEGGSERRGENDEFFLTRNIGSLLGVWLVLSRYDATRRSQPISRSFCHFNYHLNLNSIVERKARHPYSGSRVFARRLAEDLHH